MKLMKWLKEPTKDVSNGFIILLLPFILVGLVVIVLTVFFLFVAIIQGNQLFTPKITFRLEDLP